jgi:Zn-finger nucleic acid-binding protein
MITPMQRSPGPVIRRFFDKGIPCSENEERIRCAFNPDVLNLLETHVAESGTAEFIAAYHKNPVKISDYSGGHCWSWLFANNLVDASYLESRLRLYVRLVTQLALSSRSVSTGLQCDNCEERYLVRDQLSASQFDCRNCGQTIFVEARVNNKRKKHSSRSELVCPACTMVVLTERTLKNGVKVDSCKSCHGTWLDAGEFLQPTRNKEGATQNVLSLSCGAIKSKRHCPRCRTSMFEAAFLDDETRIDFCQECDGLWFDYSELKDSLQFLKTMFIEEVSE